MTCVIGGCKSVAWDASGAFLHTLQVAMIYLSLSDFEFNFLGPLLYCMGCAGQCWCAQSAPTAALLFHELEFE